MEKIFESVLLNNQIGIWSFLICIGAAIITGFIVYKKEVFCAGF